MIKFILNQQTIETNVPSGTTVLDFIRYHQQLVGTKIGCREGDCGACTVLVGTLGENQVTYQSMTACLMPIGNAQGKHIVTVEGINQENLTPVQRAIVDTGGTQCGFCTIGFVMSFTVFMLDAKRQSYEEAITAIDGNICRCTGYKSLERAAKKIAAQKSSTTVKKNLTWLIQQKYIPTYFAQIEERLIDLQPTDAPTPNENVQVIVGGGTDLFVQQPAALLQKEIHHLFDQTKLKRIYQKENQCIIGAMATANDIQYAPLLKQIFPQIETHFKLVSSTPIRNMGTLAGNLVNASPIGDLSIFFLALDSSILLKKQNQERWIKLKDFYLGYKTLDKETDEYIEAVAFEIPSSSTYFNFEKVSKRRHLDIASVNSACSLDLKNGIVTHAHLSAGGVGPTPKYLAESSKALLGKPIDAATLKMVNQQIQAEISPISDARGTAAYKRLLLRQLFYAHFLHFFPEQLELRTLV
ncbi:MAG: FAD binding domain-containing protein [Saprospiraceae bacterium]